MSELLWFPNHTESVSISYSQQQSAESQTNINMDMDAPIPTEMDTASEAPINRTQPKKRTSLPPVAFIAGGSSLQRTPPTVRVKGNSLVTPVSGINSTPMQPITQNTSRTVTPATGGWNSAQKFIPSTTTPKTPMNGVTPMTKSSVTQRTPINNINTADKENMTPSHENIKNNQTEFLSPLRFPDGEILKPTVQQVINPSTLSASPLAVSQIESFQNQAVPLNWQTPLKVAGRKSLTAPTSADPRVEAIKERVATLLKSKRKSMQQTPMMTPRPPVASEIEAFNPAVPSSELTPYSAAVEAGLATEPQFNSIVETPQSTPIPEVNSIAEEDESVPEAEIEKVTLDSEMEKVHRDTESPTKLIEEELSAPRAPVTPIKSESIAVSLTPNTLVKAERATFSRDLIASITALPESSNETEQPPTIEPLETKLAKANSWNFKKIFLFAFFVMGAAALFFTFMPTKMAPQPPTSAILVERVVEEVTHAEPIVPITPVEVEPSFEAVEESIEVMMPVVEFVAPIEEQLLLQETPVEEKIEIEFVSENIVAAEPSEFVPVADVIVEDEPIEFATVVDVAVSSIDEEVVVEPLESASIEVIEEVKLVEELSLAPFEESIAASMEVMTEEAVTVESASAVETDPAEVVTTWTWSSSSVLAAEEDVFGSFAAAPVNVIIHSTPAPIVAVSTVKEIAPEIESPNLIEPPQVEEGVVPTVELVEVAPVEVSTPIESAVPEPVTFVEPSVTVAPVEVASVAIPEVEVRSNVPEVISSTAATIDTSSAVPEVVVAPTESSHWGSTIMVSAFIGACVIGGYLQSLEGSSASTSGKVAPATGSPARVSSVSNRTASPFTFDSAPIVSPTITKPTDRISLSPIRPERRLHFSPAACIDRPDVMVSPPAFSSMAAQLNRVEPTLQAMASQLAQGAAKVAKHQPANPSIGEELLNKPATQFDDTNRLHVDVPMIIPPRVVNQLIVVEEPAPAVKATRGRRTTTAASTLSVPTPAAASIETRRSARLSRRV